MDTENLVLVVFGGLNQRAFDIFRAGIKICGILRFRGEGSAAQQRVDVGLELDFQVIFIDENFVNQQFQIISF